MARKLLIPASVLIALLGCQSEIDLNPDNPNNGTPDDTGDTPIGPGPWPDIKIEPETLTFGQQIPDCETNPKTVEVSNVGDADLEISDITGPGAAQFDSSHPTGTRTLAPGESFTFDVTFTPDNFGSFTGSVVVASNDPDEQTAGVALEGDGSENAINEDFFHQPEPDAVDVLWVIDNSCSMSGTVTTLGNELGTFIQNFTTLGLDYQIGVVTTDMDDPTDSGRLQGAGVMSPAIQGSDAAVQSAFQAASNVGAGGSATERGRDAAYAALTPPLVSNENAGFVRSDAHLAIIVISDEEDSSTINRDTFVQWLDALKLDPDKTTFSAMAGTESNVPGGFGFPDCGFTGGTTAQPSYEYPYVTHATDGLYTELCDMDFNEVLTWLSFYAAGMATRFCLTDDVASPAGLTVTVDGNPSSRVSGPPPWTSGWNLDTDNCIEFFGSSIPGPATDIVISYPVNSTCAP